MSAPPAPDVADTDREIVTAILRAHLPAGARVRAALAEAFTESDLPYKVDLLDWRTADPAFRARLEPERSPCRWTDTATAPQPRTYPPPRPRATLRPGATR